MNLPLYYSYRSILEGIHHYDLDAGKNYTFYLNPNSKKWHVIPWDIDLSWGDHMFGWGREPFMRPVLGHAEFIGSAGWSHCGSRSHRPSLSATVYVTASLQTFLTRIASVTGPPRAPP